ncbi:MAG: D-alanine--D-alanine ligase [Chlorobi bacterium]|nr:D-alanine--D-alanine ligase [Chlorobiota bacterium]
MSNQNTKIVLLLGGISSEREVSKESGKSIYNALVALGYDVKIIDPGYGLNQPDKPDDFFAADDFAEIKKGNILDSIQREEFEKADLVFLGLHGKYGEDGIIQSLLELKGLKYTGSNVRASAVAMDKNLSKILFEQVSVQTPEWFVVDESEIDEEYIVERINGSVGYPCVIKPNDSGSTIGLTICKSESAVMPALKKAAELSKKILAEKFIAGRELTVGILDDNPLPVLEIVPKKGFYDYEAKYGEGMSDYIVPAEIPEQLAKKMQTEALAAHNALGCSVYSRVDFRLSPENEYYCLEVNNLPGMTSHSLVPMMAEAVGISFAELIDRIVKLSLR